MKKEDGVGMLSSRFCISAVIRALAFRVTLPTHSPRHLGSAEPETPPPPL